MRTGQLLIKNLFSLVTAETVARVVGFITTAYLGRILGVDGFGKLGFAQSFSSYFIIVAVLGLNAYGIREIARRRDRLQQLVGQIFGIKVITTLVSFVSLLIIVRFLDRPQDVRWLMALLALSVFTNGLTMEWVFSGVEKMEWLAIVALVRNVLYLVLVFTLVRGSNDLALVAVTILVPETAAVIFFYALYRRHFGKISASFTTTDWNPILYAALPLALTSFVVQIFYRIDIVMLGFLTTDRVTGWYVSASAITLSLLGLGSLFSSALYPTLSRLFHESPERAQLLLRYSARFLISVSLPIAVGGVVIAPKIIQTVYGPGYEGAVLPFRILILSIVTSFCSVPYITALIARDERKYFVAATSTGAAVNFFLNLFLIPRYQQVGAAVATIIAEIVVFSIAYVYGRKVVHYSFAGMFPKPIVAAAVMGCVAWLIDFNTVAVITISVVVYIVIIGVIGGVEFSDLQVLRSNLFNKNS